MTVCRVHPRRIFLVAAVCAATAVLPRSAQTQAVSSDEAQAIAADAYLYFYPLITMDLTRKQLINTEPGKGIGGPMNTFVNIPPFLPPT